MQSMSESQSHTATTSTDNPCLSCGACCAHFRVSFYWAEATALDPALTEPVSPHLSCMRGTNQPEPRWAALRGEIGGPTACGDYLDRPSPCRELQAGDDKCRRARAHYGLPALPPAGHAA